MSALDGKVALVTGGGRGIGRGIVEAFLAAGARVVVAQRGPLPREWGDAKTARVRGVAVDLADADAAANVIAGVAEKEGRLDVLVNNAGMMFERSVEDTALVDWDALIALNLTAPFILAKHAAPVMRRGGGGSIVNIGSIEGLGANPRHVAYCTSKAGLHGMTRALAVDLGPEIRCNAVAPGWIETELNAEMVAAMGPAERVAEELERLHPAGRIGTAADVAEAVLFLASDAAAFVTGQILTVDGGRTAKLSLPGRVE